MSNAVVTIHRQADPDDQRSDDAITSLYAASPAAASLAQKYPDFAADAQRVAAERQAALRPSMMQEFGSGVSRGTSGLLSTLEGAGGLAAKFVGADTPANYLLQKAQANEQDAAANPPSVPSLSDANSASDYAHYFLGKAGELVPNLGEALTTSAIGGAVGGAVGTEVEPGGGTVAGAALGAVGGLFEKQAIKSLIRKKAIEGLADLETTAGKALLSKETSQIARSAIGQHVADTVNFWAQSAGGTYNELSKNPNVDPNTAIDVSILGGLAQAVPAQFLPHQIMKGFFGDDAAVGPYWARLVSQGAKTVPGGMAAMSLQELGSIASEKYADPATRDQAFDLPSWSKGDVSRLINASATGGLAGLVGAPIAAIPKGEAKIPDVLKSYTGDLSKPENQSKLDELAQLAQKDIQSGLNLRDQDMVDNFPPEKRNAYKALKADVEQRLQEALGPQPSRDFLDRSDLPRISARIADNPSPLVQHPELDDADVLHQLWENEGGRPLQDPSDRAPIQPTPSTTSVENIPFNRAPPDSKGPETSLTAARNAAVQALNPEEESIPKPVSAIEISTLTKHEVLRQLQARFGLKRPEQAQALLNDPDSTHAAKVWLQESFNDQHWSNMAQEAGGSATDAYRKTLTQAVGEINQAKRASGLMESPSPIAAKPPEPVVSESPKPDWRVVVQGKQGEVPGYVQIVDPRQTERSQSPTVESLRAAGHAVPDFSQLPTGKYSWDEAVAHTNEPPVKEGFTRLYRGEGEANVKLPEWAKANAGQWFSSRRQKAVDFQEARGGKMRFVDVPTADLEHYRAPSGNALDEYLIPKQVQENLSQPAEKSAPEGQPALSVTPPVAKITYENDVSGSKLKKVGVVTDLGDLEKDGGDIIKVGGKPVGWMKVDDNGVLHAIEIKPEFRRKGIASVVVRDLANTQGSDRVRVFLPTEEGRRLFESLGKLTVNEHGEGFLNLGEAEPVKVTNKAAETLAKPSNLQVGPDQIDFGNTTLKSKETLAGEPSFFRIQPEESEDANTLGERLVSGARSKTQTDPYQATRRLTAVEDKETGKVYLLSTFKEKRGGEIKLADPEKIGDKKSPNTTLTRLLAEQTGDEDRYTPIASIRTETPRKAFVQEYPDRAVFEEHMGKPAEQQLATIASHAQSLEEQHNALMIARGLASPEAHDEEPAGFTEAHAQLFDKLFGAEKELPSQPDFEKQFDDKIIGAGNAGYAALKFAMRAMLDHEPGITGEEALRKVKEQIYENLRDSFKKGAEPFEDAALRSFGQEPVEQIAGRGNGAAAAHRPAGGLQPETPAELGAAPEQKSGGGNPVVNNPANLSFRQPAQREDGKADQRHAILLDTIHRAALDAGLNIARIGQDISGLAGEFAKRTGAAYDSASRTVAQVVSDVVGREDIVTSLHEVGEDVLAQLKKTNPDMAAVALRAIDSLGDRQLGLDVSADPRIRASNPSALPQAVLSSERLAEATALALTNNGFDPAQSKGFAQQFVRALKDLYLRAAISIQRALFGDEFTSPELAVKYFENRVKQFLAGDFNRNSFIEMLGGGNVPQAHAASWHDNGKALFERLGVNGRPECQHVPDLSVDASRLNNLVFRQPEQDADERRLNIEKRSALLNHQLDAIDKSARSPAIIKLAVEAKLTPHDFLIKRVGYTDPVEQKIEIQKDIDADKIPIQYDHQKTINGFKAESEALPVARDAYVNMQAMAAKAGEVRAEAVRKIASLNGQSDELLQAHEQARTNHLDWQSALSDGQKAIQREGRRLFASIAGQAKRMGVIEQQLRKIDPNADLKRYGPVFQKLFTGDELKGERLYTVLNTMVNDASIDFSKPVTEIRDAMKANPAYEKFVQNTPESKALTATIVAYAKTNARAMANLELRSMKSGEERQAVGVSLDQLRQEKGDFLNTVNTLPKTAKIADRVRQAYRQSLQDVRSLKERIRLAEEEKAAAEAMAPVLESEQAKLAGKLGIGTEFSYGHGAKYVVPLTAKAETSELLKVHTGDEEINGWETHELGLDTTNGEVSSPEVVEGHLRQMAAFLNERESQFASGEEGAKDAAYWSVKSQFNEMAANKNFRLNVTPSDRFMAEVAMGAEASKLEDAGGTASMRSVGVRLRREVQIMDAMRPSGEVMWRKTEQLKAVLKAMLPPKTANKDLVIERDFMNPAKKTMMAQHALAEQYAGRPEALKNALYNRVMTTLLNNDATAKYICGNEVQWREALINLLEHHQKSADYMEKQNRGEDTRTILGRKLSTGHGVSDERLKAVNPATGELETAVRKSIPTGPVTFPQKFANDFRAMVNALKNSGWFSDDGKSLAGNEFGKIAETIRNGQDPNAIIGKYFNHPIHGTRVRETFLRSLAQMDTESLFDGPKESDGVTSRPVDIAKALTAWNESKGDPLTFASRLYDLHGGQDVRDENGNIIQDKASYIQSIFQELESRAMEASRLNDGMERSPNSAKSPIRGMISDFALDARKIEHLPAQWFDYHSFNQNDVTNMMKRIAAQNAFDRGSEGLANDLDVANQEVQQAKFNLQNARDAALSENPNLSPHRPVLKPWKMSELDKVLADNPAIGPTTLKNWKRLAGSEKLLRNVINGISTYHRRDNSPDGNLNAMIRAMHTIGSLMVNQPSSALQLLTQLSDVSLRYGASGSVVKTIAGAYLGAAKDVAGSLLNAVGIQLIKGGELHDLYYRLGLNDPAYVQRLRDSFGNLEGEHPVGHFLRAANDVLGTPVGKHTDNPRHVPFTPFKLFDMFGAVADQRITHQVWQLAMQHVGAGMDYYRNNLIRLQEPGFKLGAEELGLKGAAKDSFQRFAADMARWDLNYDDMVRGALERGDKTALSDSEALRLYSMAVSGIALRGSLATSSSGWYNNNIVRLGAPLIRWSFDRMIQIGGLRLDENGQRDMKKFARAIAGLSLTAGGGIAVSALVDQYFQTLIGKQRNLRPVLNAPNANQAALGVMEELSRAGTFGLFGELANSVVGLGQGGDNRVLSVDQRVLAVSSLQSIFSAASAWANQGFNADYPHVVRPLLQSVGGGGLIQYMQLANRAMGLDNEEARVTTRINAQNYLRVVGRELGMDVRVPTGGASNPTPMTPYLTGMELAAYKNDPMDFREAYASAVRAAREQGQEDPVDYVKRAFSTRNPLRSVFATAPTEQDYNRLLANMPGSGREDVSQAVRLFNQYAESIGAKGFDGKVPKATQAASQFKVPSLGDFRQRALEAIQ